MAVFADLRRLCIVLIAISFLPTSVFLLVINYLIVSLKSQHSLRRQLKNTSSFHSRSVLISGIHTPQGLRLARAFYDTGHIVIGLGYQPGRIPIAARLSSAVHKFYSLKPPLTHDTSNTYICSLLAIIETQGIDLWINCSNDIDATVEAQARSNLEQDTKCICFALRPRDVSHFAARDNFLNHVQSLGLPVPEMYQVGSRDEVHNVLNKGEGRRRYLLHSPSKTGSTARASRTILPKRTLSQTYNTVSQIGISRNSPFWLEQDTEGLERFTTFSIIVRGKVKTFVASTTTKSGSLRVVDPRSALNRSMYHYVQSFARKQGDNYDSHICVDFCAEERIVLTGVETLILPINASIQAHSNLLFFQGLRGSVQLTSAYLTALDTGNGSNGYLSHSTPSGLQNAEFEESAILESRGNRIYNSPRLLSSVLLSCINLLLLRIRVVDFWRAMVEHIQDLVYGIDDTYALRDPLPFWWYYQIYMPTRILLSVVTRVSDPPTARIDNVSD